MLSCFGFLLYLYLLYVLSPYLVIQIQPHCCICPRSKVRIWGRRYYFWSSEPGWPGSEWCSPVPSIYMWVIGFHSSTWLSKIPLCRSTTFSWSIRQYWSILVVSISWLLWIVLQETHVFRCLWSSLYCIPLGISPRVGLLDHMTGLHLDF
jgi:hypothetical protein